MNRFFAAIRLMRPSTSLLAFLSIMLPTYSRTGSLTISLERAVPLLLISLCTFIINDLDDIEKDRINHPDRPLPCGDIEPKLAASLYFTCLAFALLTVKTYINDASNAFLYYLLIIAITNYGYVVEYLTPAKALYVACAASIPIFILANWHQDDLSLPTIALANMLFNLGREMCKDIADRAGDARSFFHRFDADYIAIGSFGLQYAGIVLFYQIADTPADIVALFIIAIFAVYSTYCWFIQKKINWSIAMMKVELFAGIWYLL